MFCYNFSYFPENLILWSYIVNANRSRVRHHLCSCSLLPFVDWIAEKKVDIKTDPISTDSRNKVPAAKRNNGKWSTKGTNISQMLLLGVKRNCSIRWKYSIKPSICWLFQWTFLHSDVLNPRKTGQVCRVLMSVNDIPNVKMWAN